MKLAGAPDTDPRLAALAAADDATADASAADAIVLPCGAVVPQLELAVLVWNIRELGGGFHMPPARPDYCIDAYAALIAAMQADVCVLAGLRGTPERVVTSQDGVFTYADAVNDTGIAEAKKILASLQKAAADGDWALSTPADSSGVALYEGGTTSAFLYKKAGGRTLIGLDTLNGRADATLGLGGHLAHLSLKLPLEGDDPLTFDLLTPLGATAAKGEKAPTVDGTQPTSFVLAFSASDDLTAQRGPLDAVQSAVTADSRPLLAHGSVLGDSFWHATTRSAGGLLDDFTAIGAADLERHDAEMHWEALPDPKHAGTSTDVAGSVGDAVLTRNAEPRARYAVREVRVIDMMRAALGADEITTVGGDAAPCDEDSSLGAMRASHRTATPYLGPDAPTTPTNIVAECADFLHLLSDHWPVLATLVVRAPAPAAHA
ncbi:MAG TPA: hypothetical protein VN706_18895 [Gemmatimonadaceae bacterium]|nr:hypothetical protein [Gemmatimonadaceae bacterium]